MENKKLTIGALALGLGFAGLAQASQTRPENPDVAVAFAADDAQMALAGCNGECNGSCGNGGDGGGDT